MIVAKIDRSGNIYAAGFREGFSSLLEDGTLGEFYNSLSLRDIATEEKIDPIGLESSTRTDYGLIYNTDGSLCATLLPEGGVAVTEGTTNLCDPAYMYTNTWTTIGYDWNISTFIDCTAGDIISISADIRNLSQGEDRRWGGVGFHDSEGTELEFHNAWGSGMSERRLSFTTPAAPVGTVEARVYWISSREGDTYQGKNFQIEKKPYDTPFVDGTRVGGVLDYPIQLSGDFTIAFYWWVPISQLGNKDRSVLALSNGTNVLNFFQGWTSDWYLGDEMNRARFRLADFAPDAYTIYHIVLRRQGEVVSVFRDGALWDTVDFGAAPNFTTLRLGGLSPQSNLPNSVYDKLLIRPHHAVSPETIATWYSTKLRLCRTGHLYIPGEIKEGYTSPTRLTGEGDLKIMGEVKEYCPYILGRGYFAPLDQSLAVLNLETEYSEPIYPIGYDTAERTDYGLVVGDNLCATLLPEGGVAVEEATSNLWDNPGWLTGDLTGWGDYGDGLGTKQVISGDSRFKQVLRLEKTDATAYRYGIAQSKIWDNTGTILSDSVYVKVLNAASEFYLCFYCDYRSANGDYYYGRGWYMDLNTKTTTIHSNGTVRSYPVGDGWYRIEYTTAETDIKQGWCYFWLEGNVGTVLLAHCQKEAAPYCTSFTVGNRPPGALDIPTNLSLLQSGTIAFTVWTPKKMTDHDTYQNGALMNICQGDVRQLDLWMRNTGIEFCVNGEQKKTISYEPNTKYKIIVTWEDGGNPKFYLDGALQYAGTEQFTDAGNGILQLGRFAGEYVNTVYFKNLQVY